MHQRRMEERVTGGDDRGIIMEKEEWRNGKWVAPRHMEIETHGYGSTCLAAAQKERWDPLTCAG